MCGVRAPSGGDMQSDAVCTCDGNMILIQVLIVLNRWRFKTPRRHKFSFLMLQFVKVKKKQHSDHVTHLNELGIMAAEAIFVPH